MHSQSLTSASLCQSYAGASRIVAQVLEGRSLTESIESLLREMPAGIGRAAVHDLSYQTLRDYGWVHFIVKSLVEKPPSTVLVVALLYVTLSDLRRRTRSYVAVDQAVRAARLLGCHNLAGFVNAVLRNYLRQADVLERAVQQDPVAMWRHPDWWIAQIRASYPDGWESILRAGNQHPPLTLRVNRRRIDASEYLDVLAVQGLAARQVGEHAIRLDVPLPVTAIPGFAQGLVSVQDAGAQRAAVYLFPKAAQRVLDACSAPGGKTAHLLEMADCDLTAIDNDPRRCVRVKETLRRLGLNARVLEGDATQLGGWWDGKPFDRVLADAPCSASGIARRRPDIKWHRRASDLAGYAATQSRMLDTLWGILAPGGRLLYSTCSLFSTENGARIERFLDDHADARAVELTGLKKGQLIPGDDNDGFYYALLEKC